MYSGIIRLIGLNLRSKLQDPPLKILTRIFESKIKMVVRVHIANAPQTSRLICEIGCTRHEAHTFIR